MQDIYTDIQSLERAREAVTGETRGGQGEGELLVGGGSDGSRGSRPDALLFGSLGRLRKVFGRQAMSAECQSWA